MAIINNGGYKFYIYESHLYNQYTNMLSGRFIIKDVYGEQCNEPDMVIINNVGYKL